MAGDSKKLQPIIIKKVKKGGHAVHGGAWKIAYADFVTAMMAFFLLMWLLGATNEKQRKALADYFAPTLIEFKQNSAGSNGLLGGDAMQGKDNYPTMAKQTGTRSMTIPAGAQGGDVGGDGRRGGEPRGGQAVAGRLGGHDGGVGEHRPAVRGHDGEGERGLEVGLLEDGEHPPRVRDLELAVEVDLVVDGVDEAVQALTGVRVRTIGDDDEFVARPEVGQCESDLLVVSVDAQRLAVQRRRDQPRCDEVDEGRRAFAGAERDRRRRAECLLAGLAGAVGEVEVDPVGDVVQDVTAGSGLVAGQVRRSHA